MIGINPNSKSSTDKSIDISEDEKLTYLHKFESDIISPQIIEVFKSADLENILTNSTIKTNFYYIATQNEADIYKCLDSVSGEFASEFYNQSAIWTKKLVEILKPKFILCEGKGVFDKVIDMYKSKNMVKWKDECGLCKISDKELVVIGYSRLYSNIKNKIGLSNLLKEQIK